MPFINRTTELAYLNNLHQKNTAQLIVLYGKRRVGKTALIREFLREKSGVYYLADQGPAKDQLRELGIRIGTYFQDALLQEYGFQKWTDLFKYLAAMVKKPFVLAIDEYPYLVEHDAATGSYFQKGWDEHLKDSQVFLILCGSSMAMMESETLAYKAPLYGRRTGQILVEPMTFDAAHLFFESHPFETFLKYYAVVGGMPAYLTQFQAYTDIKQAVLEQVLPTTTFLHNEIPFLLREELREPRLYMFILQAISQGKHRQSEIVNASGIESGNIQKYLGVLRALRFIDRLVPVTEEKPEKSKRGLYVISDPFVRFWFRYVAPFRSELALGNVDYVIHKYMDTGRHLEALAYESYAQHWVAQPENSPFVLQRIGKWWDKSEEIDVVALNTSQNDILFGEVKWSSKPVGEDILDNLQRKSRLVPWGAPHRKNHFILFSRSGFTDALLTRACREGVVLVHGDRRVEISYGGGSKG